MWPHIASFITSFGKQFYSLSKILQDISAIPVAAVVTFDMSSRRTVVIVLEVRSKRSRPHFQHPLPRLVRHAGE